ncbi:MAG TPA: citrate synthase/methylcitrate synthase [Anaerolineae bacterium]
MISINDNLPDTRITSAAGTGKPTYIPGLENVIAARTHLSHVEGEKGGLFIAGFPLEEIAPRASFEEMVYLLWHDTLPDAAALDEFRRALAAERTLAPVTRRVLEAAAAQNVPPMDALRMAAGTLDIQAYGGDLWGQGAAVLARLATIVAVYVHLVKDESPIEPRSDLDYAANYLYMLWGREPNAVHVRALETYLNTVIDHGLNASTFTARVIISTGSDLVSAVVGAIGALKGPLHGGAPGPALDMVLEIGEATRAEDYVRGKLERKERLMGFGHRVYRARDPRADVLGAAADRLYQEGGDRQLYALAKSVEQTALRLLAEYHPERKLQTNVEFYTALLLHGLGLPASFFTPTFAISRAAGWIAHAVEQKEQNRLIRPQSEYVGSRDRRWQELEDRDRVKR